jgi:hypothetical protein
VCRVTPVCAREYVLALYILNTETNGESQAPLLSSTVQVVTHGGCRVECEGVVRRAW